MQVQPPCLQIALLTSSHICGAVRPFGKRSSKCSKSIAETPTCSELSIAIDGIIKHGVYLIELQYRTVQRNSTLSSLLRTCPGWFISWESISEVAQHASTCWFLLRIAPKKDSGGWKTDLSVGRRAIILRHYREMIHAGL